MVKREGGRKRQVRPHAQGRPFVGREAEIDELVSGWRSLRGGAGRLVLISGEAGIGKTRLCEVFAERATRRRGRVAWGRGWEGGGSPPYWPWIQVLRGLVRTDRQSPLREDRHSSTQVVPMLPRELAGSAPAAVIGHGEPPAERFTMFDAAAGYLRSVAKAEAAILVLDDLHAADPASLSLLQFLAGELRDLPLMILATFREDELRREPLSFAIVSKLARETNHLRLRGLAEAEVGLLIGELLRAPPAESLVSAIHRATAGNPFFVDGAVRMIQERRGDAPTSLASTSGITVPSDVTDLIRRRLSGLGDVTVRVLSVASVIGLEFDERWLATIEPEIAEPVRGAIAAGLAEGLLSKHGSRHAFDHSLVRDTLYGDLPRHERVRLHARVAECLEASSEFDAEERIAPLAHHWFEAVPLAGAEKAVEYHLLAAAQALSRLAYEETANHFERALEALLFAPAADAETRARILMTLDRAKRLGGPAPADPVETEPATGSDEGNLFRRDGEYWTIRFRGRLLRIRDAKGIHYLAELLRHPREDLHVGRLAALALDAAPGELTSARLGADAGPLLDGKARSAYRSRIAELRAELDDAEGANDAGRMARLRGEIEFLELEIRRAFGLGGRGRRGADVGERMRKAVTNRIRDAIGKIAREHRDLGRHLESSIRLGAFCRYDPRDGVEWRIGSRSPGRV